MAAETPRVGVAGIVGDGRGRCLLVRRGHPPAAGLWAFPGGSLQWSEPMAAGVAREVAEECGSEVAVERPLYVTELLPTQPGDPHFVIVDWGCRWLTGSPRAETDAAEVRWVDDQAWRALPLAPGMREALENTEVRRFLGWR
jgi:8-oxo-dGTP diphosphatase